MMQDRGFFTASVQSLPLHMINPTMLHLNANYWSKNKLLWLCLIWGGDQRTIHRTEIEVYFSDCALYDEELSNSVVQVIRFGC